MRENKVRGIIYTKDQCNIEYAICYIEQITYENDSVKYIFKPYYDIIELCNASFFQGIPGLNLDLKKKDYIRDKTPTFIYERTPQENREDLWDLLDEVNLEYLDKLEWLIRTNKVYTGDNLFVRRYYDSTNRKSLDEINYGDVISVDNLITLGRNQYQITKTILNIIASGATLRSDDFIINHDNRKDIFTVLYSLFKKEYMNRKEKQQKGIDKAKTENRYKGRSKIEISLPKLAEVVELLDKNKITIKEAMGKLGLTSRSTFYRRIKEYKEKFGSGIN